MVQYGYPGPQQGGVMVAGVPPPLPQKYDWKDMFIAAVVAGGFGYGMWQVAKVIFFFSFTDHWGKECAIFRSKTHTKKEKVGNCSPLK